MSVQQELSEKRKSPRVASELPVRWVRASGNVHGVAINVSAEGLFLEMDTMVDVGVLMRLEVLLPDGLVPLLGQSRFCGDTPRGHGIGVLIFAMDDAVKARWLAHYHELLAGGVSGRRKLAARRAASALRGGLLVEVNDEDAVGLDHQPAERQAQAAAGA